MVHGLDQNYASIFISTALLQVYCLSAQCRELLCNFRITKGLLGQLLFCYRISSVCLIKGTISHLVTH